jgi:drug/metabolite transporter (DMT)-like permease
MTIGGVAWVVLERQEGGAARRDPRWGRGLALAFAAAACQAGGLWLSKQGMGHGWLPRDQHLDPQAATLLRMVFAGLGIIPIVILHFRRERKRRAAGLVARQTRSWRSGMLLATGGAVVGPYLGVWMSLVASDRAPLGIAQTLCSLSPVLLLPFAATIHKERIGLRAVLGAVVAVAGSALLFARPH